MARSVTQVSGQLFWHLIMKIYQIWWLLPLGVAPKSLGNFFIELFRERGFSGQRSLRMKNQLYKICSCYVSLECILYWFENTKEPMPENQYLRRIHNIIDSIRKLYFYWGVRCGYKILKRSVKLTRFKSFPLQLSRHQDIPLLSFVRVASSTLLRCG